MTGACLGLDTSCYRTSVALCGAESGAADGPFFQQGRLLSVPEGQRGLMQSEAVFQHVQRLPQLIEALMAEAGAVPIRAVCASASPRDAEGSYMPVFRVGEGAGRAVAAALGVPFLATTHQQGHLRAARIGTALDGARPYLALHLSGGTTEILRVDGDAAALLGGTRDLHAGQLIDRVGVAMGLPFPAGPSLERLAMEGRAEALLPASIRGNDCHLSGAERQALAWVQAGSLSPPMIAAEVFDCIARTVVRLILSASEGTGLSDVLLGGGVASSSWLRDAISRRVAKRNHGIRLFFSRPELAGDNAVGVALIGMERAMRT